MLSNLHSSHHHHHHQHHKSRVQSSIIKSIFTFYLLSSIIYTSTVYLILPTISFLSDFRPITFIHSIILSNQNQFNQHHHLHSSPQITPRLLPDRAHFLATSDVQIRKTLKGTDVNTDEVVAEDQSSLWTSTKPTSSIQSSNHPLSKLTHFPTRMNSSNQTSKNLIQWFPPHHPLSKTSNSNHLFPSAVRLDIHTNDEDFFLSKAFSDALGPSKVVPYYYRAIGPHSNGEFDQKDITITTLVTSNRFKVFAKLVEHYQGPISATIHVSNVPEILEPLLASLETMYRSSPAMATWVDIHLVVDSFDRQFNMWRNVAKWFSRTSYVMMLDVDFWICTDFRTRVISNPHYLSLLESGQAALVIPAFEFTKQSDGVNPTQFPNQKSTLRSLFQDGKIDMFHKSWIPGHGPTDYQKFFQSDESYQVISYTHSYEPYVIYKKDGSPFCDERFIGYGGNKAACLFELYLSGVTFHVLPQDFLIHQSHPYAEKTRQHERKFNRKLYTDFREEVCFRKLYQFLELNQAKLMMNLLNECKKVSLLLFF
ncbi:family 49 glycosyltransferase [Melampsora americana]|nr:family 49 glycosyltransferase [Melampsora americana]